MNAIAAGAAVGDHAGTFDRAPLQLVPGSWLATVRAAAVLFFSLLALAEIALIIPFIKPSERLASRAAWLHDWCRFACRILGVEVTVRGKIPRNGLVVSNHLSYLDIIAISAITPCIFVAKSDVGRWPLFGWLAKCGGAIFVNRRSKADARAAVASIRDAINSDVLVVLFPEGTSSDGRTVLPFKSALMEPALQFGSIISAASIDYDLPGGSVPDEVCYWRDMTLVPHLLNLFSKPGIKAELAFARFRYRSRDRKIVAPQIRKQILQMRS